MFRATLIAVALAVAAPAHAQVRVITGDIEHVYGPGGQILDDDALRARNEHVERMQQIERDRRDAIRRQEELAAAAAQAAAPVYQEQESPDDGPYVGGVIVGRQNRHANLRRSGVVSGHVHVGGRR